MRYGRQNCSGDNAFMNPGRQLRPTFIRNWRKHRGYTLERLADMIGTSHATLSRIERGIVPYNQKLLERAAEALSCEPADLIMRDPLDPDGIWSIWDQAGKGERAKIVDMVKVLVKHDRQVS